jgi:hypothetical protein
MAARDHSPCLCTSPQQPCTIPRSGGAPMRLHERLDSLHTDFIGRRMKHIERHSLPGIVKRSSRRRHHGPGSAASCRRDIEPAHTCDDCSRQLGTQRHSPKNPRPWSAASMGRILSEETPAGLFPSDLFIQPNDQPVIVRENLGGDMCSGDMCRWWCRPGSVGCGSS